MRRPALVPDTGSSPGGGRVPRTSQFSSWLVGAGEYKVLPPPYSIPRCQDLSPIVTSRYLSVTALSATGAPHSGYPRFFAPRPQPLREDRSFSQDRPPANPSTPSRGINGSATWLIHAYKGFTALLCSRKVHFGIIWGYPYRSHIDGCCDRLGPPT